MGFPELYLTIDDDRIFAHNIDFRGGMLGTLSVLNHSFIAY